MRANFDSVKRAVIIGFRMVCAYSNIAFDAFIASAISTIGFSHNKITSIMVFLLFTVLDQFIRILNCQFITNRLFPWASNATKRGKSLNVNFLIDSQPKSGNAMTSKEVMHLAAKAPAPPIAQK